MKFATKYLTYFPPHLIGVGTLSCKLQKTEIGEILLHLTH